MVDRNILRLTPALVTAAAPAGIGSPDLDLERLASGSWATNDQ